MLQSDLRAIKNNDNRAKAAVKVLEDLGYIVHLERGRQSILPKVPKPKLRLVKRAEDDE